MERRLFSEDSVPRLSLLAVLVGLVAGLGAWGFRGLIAFFHNLSFLGVVSFQYDANLHTPPSPFGAGVILAPAVGGIAVAFLVKTFAPEAKGHGVPEIMDAIYYGRGVIRPVVAVVKSLASAITIGTGGAVGREGPIAQIGASFGSTVGQLVPMPSWQRITLIAAGAGGGIAATFNTPIGGLLFAVELILTEVSARTLIPVALATGTATTLGRWFFGDSPSFVVPALTLPLAQAAQPEILSAHVILGLLLGAAAWALIRAICGCEDLFERLPGNYYTRHVPGMLLVGATMYLVFRGFGHYYVEGVGYATVQEILTDLLTDPVLLFVLFGAKLMATSVTLGSGGSGGIFSPSLFLGATLAGGYGLLLNRLVPWLNLDVTGVAVVGMAGLVGATTGAAVTAMVMVVEMTRDYNVIVPLMITVSIAYGVRRLLMPDSIYTVKLSRRGHEIPQSLHTHWFVVQTAGDLVRAPAVCVLHGEALQGFPEGGDGSPRPHMVVIDGEEVRAVVRGDRPGEQGEKADRPAVTAGSRFIVVDARDLILDVMARLRAEEAEVALVTREGRYTGPHEVIGVLTRDEIARIGNLPAWITGRRGRRASDRG